MSSCYEQFCNTADQFSDHEFLYIPSQATAVYAAGPVRYSYAETRREIVQYASALREAGYGRGDRLATILENRAEFFFTFLALNSVGATLVPIHPDLSTAEKTHLIGHSEALAVIVLPEYENELKEVCADIASTPRVVRCDSLNDLPARSPRSTELPGEQTEAAILYTSGTTGQPKGCILKNEYFLSWGNWYLNLGGLATLRPGHERLITPLPTNHQNALACSLMGMLMSGGCIVQLDRFSSRSWWPTVRESRATIIHYLGVMPAMLLNMPAAGGEDFGAQIKFGLGAGVDPKHHAAFEERFGFPLLEGWAMTETGGVACIMTTEEPRHVGMRCIGRAPESLDWRIVADDGSDCQPDEAGELLVRASGPNPRRTFFAGYHQDPEATEEAWADNYFHTGDVVRHDADGYFYFIDRRKNVIRRSGENIAAIEVEACLIRHDAVQACAVTAVPDEFRGEEVMALIVPADTDINLKTLAQDIQEFVADGLVYFKAPGHIAFVNALPIGSTQKVKRGEITDLAGRVIGTAGHFDLCTNKKRSKAGQ